MKITVQKVERTVKVEVVNRVVTVNKGINNVTVNRVGRRGEKGEPGDPATNLVQSVNGKQGVVILDSTDVNADPSGSATQALQDANEYTDDQITGIDTGVTSVVAGNNVTVDNTDPKNPVVSSLIGGVGAVASVNGQTGVVVLDQDDIADGVDNKQYSQIEKTKLQGIEANAQVNPDPTTLPVSTATQTALDNKRNKISTINRAYTTDSNGVDSETQYTSGNTSSTLMFRDTSGRSSVNAGTTGNHIVNKTQLDTKQDTLVSGTTIKTVNGTTLLGVGDLVISGSGAADSVNGRTGAVTGLAEDNSVVHITGDEAIAGVKTFNNNIVMASTSNIVSNTGTGTMIGTAATEKLGFFGATPVVRQLANAELGAALATLGLRASGNTWPITTSGAVAMTGNIRLGVANISANATLSTSSVLNQNISAATGNVTITLPATTTAGYRYRLKRLDATANTVTILGNIDGATNYLLANQYDAIELMSTTTSGTWTIWTKAVTQSSGINATNLTTTTTPSTITINSDTGTDATIAAADGTNAGLLLPAEKAKITATTGTNTGDQTTITGNAGSATVLQTARTINGVSFNGSANVTVADATKEPMIAAGMTSQYYRGDKSWQTLNQDAVSDGTTNKAFTATNQTKLAGIAEGAEVNVNADWNATSGDAQILNKPIIPTVDYPVTSVNTRTGDVTGLAEQSSLTAHTSNISNPHSVTKAQVGLENVDNTSDASKPVSTATNTALSGKANTVHTHTGADITGTGKSATTYLRGDNTWVTPTNTTYSIATQAEIENAASTTARLITGQRMAQGVLFHAPVKAADIANFETTTQLNARDTVNRSRANHTGTQAQSTITNLTTDLAAKQNAITVSTTAPSSPATNQLWVDIT